jgi:hypothetical protein
MLGGFAPRLPLPERSPTRQSQSVVFPPSGHRQTRLRKTTVRRTTSKPAAHRANSRTLNKRAGSTASRTADSKRRDNCSKVNSKGRSSNRPRRSPEMQQQLDTKQSCRRPSEVSARGLVWGGAGIIDIPTPPSSRTARRTYGLSLLSLKLAESTGKSCRSLLSGTIDSRLLTLHHSHSPRFTRCSRRQS